jgi:hypothetical protein
MFYKKEEVDSVLLCSICSDVFQDNDPRMLPCGESACHRCISSSSDAHAEFECKICNEKHRPSSHEGFPPNLILLRLTKTKADQVYRNPNVDKLSSKLAELRQGIDDLEFNIKNGADQVKEFCIQLRNQVHLQTDSLIEQVYQFNEKMIAEIDNYEKRCVDSFSIKSIKYEKDRVGFFEEINKFYHENSRLLSQFKIDDDKVHDSLTLADKYIKNLKKEDSMLRKIKFNGQSMEFKNSETKLDKSFLGSLVKKQLSFNVDNIEEIEFNTQDYHSDFHLFKLANHTNAAFYIDTSFYPKMVTFDNAGQVINQYPNLFHNFRINHLRVVKVSDKFIIHVCFDTNSEITNHFNNQVIARCNASNYAAQSLLLIADEKLNYIQHLPLNYWFPRMAANSSQLICIDWIHNLFCFDSNLNEVVTSNGLKKLQDNERVVFFEMSEMYLFALCCTQKLKVFDLDAFHLVKEIDVHASQLKCVSTGYLVLFNPATRHMFLYEQDGNFALEEEISLAELIEPGMSLSRDRTQFVSLFNSVQMKYFNFS